MFKLLPLLFAPTSMSQMPKSENISVRVNDPAVDCGTDIPADICNFIKNNPGKVNDLLAALLSASHTGTGNTNVGSNTPGQSLELTQAIASLQGTTGLTPDKLNMLLSSVNQLKNQTDSMLSSLNNGNVNPVEMQNIQHELNYLLSSLPTKGGGQNTLQQIKDSLGQVALTPEQEKLLSNQYGTNLNELKDLPSQLQNIQNSLNTAMNKPEFKDMLKALANQSPEMLKDLQASGLVNQQSLQNLANLNNVVPPSLKIPKSVMKMATSIDRTITIFMWCLAGILFLFGTVGLISSMNTLRYKTLITHKKLFKNPKFLFMTWLLVLLGGVGATLGALYG